MNRSLGWVLVLLVAGQFSEARPSTPQRVADLARRPVGSPARGRCFTNADLATARGRLVVSSPDRATWSESSGRPPRVAGPAAVKRPAGRPKDGSGVPPPRFVSEAPRGTFRNSFDAQATDLHRARIRVAEAAGDSGQTGGRR